MFEVKKFDAASYSCWVTNPPGWYPWITPPWFTAAGGIYCWDAVTGLNAGAWINGVCPVTLTSVNPAGIGDAGWSP